MIEFTSSLQPLDLNLRAYTKTLDRILSQIIREAAREWLRAIIKSVDGSFPVWSGAAKSSFKPLASALNKVSLGPINPVPGAPDRRALGEQLATFTIIDSRNNGGSFEYEFNWSTVLPWYEDNEDGSGDNTGWVAPSAPWHSLPTAREAFELYVSDAVDRRLPDIGDYLSVRAQ